MRDVSPRLEERARERRGARRVRALSFRLLIVRSLHLFSTFSPFRASVPPHYPDGALLPCLPEFGILSETIPPSLSPRWDGPIYGNLVEGVVAAGPFLEVVVGKQETAIAPPAVE